MAAGNAKGSVDPQEELVRLMVIQVRRTIGTQNDTILELDRAGFGATRIAELLGTTPGTVNQALVKARKRGKANAK